MERLDVKLRLVTLKTRSFKSLNIIEKEVELRELREITRKKINNIEKLKTGNKQIEELQIEGESEATRLLADLYIEEDIEIDKLLK